MSPWLSASFRRATPYFVYLVVYAIFSTAWLLFKEHVDSDLKGFMVFLIVGSSLGVFIAIWRLAMAFIPDARFAEGRSGYIEVPDFVQPRPFGEQLLEYASQLRRIALSYERHRQNLTRIGVTVAIASLAVPVATWTVILLDAFSKKESMPNAWLLVVSSTTTGALGLAISVTLLRHLKNNQKPLAELSQRLMLCIEANIATSATDGTPELKASILASALSSFVRPPSIASIHADPTEHEGENDRKLATTLISALKPSREE